MSDESSESRADFFWRCLRSDVEAMLDMADAPQAGPVAGTPARRAHFARLAARQLDAIAGLLDEEATNATRQEAVKRD